MRRQRSFLLGTAALAGMVFLAWPAAAFENGPLKSGSKKRAPAVYSPVDKPDVPHPGAVGPKPGPNLGPHNHGTFYPYYSPVIPVANRWRYHKYTPYYPGYCRPWGKQPCMYGSEDCLGLGPDAVIGPGPYTYGPFTGAPRNEDVLVHLGAGGLTTPPLPPGCAPGEPITLPPAPAIANPLPPMAPVGAPKEKEREKP